MSHSFAVTPSSTPPSTPSAAVSADPYVHLEVLAYHGLGGFAQEFDAFAKALAEEADAPAAMVNLITRDQQVFVGMHLQPGTVLPGGRTMPTDQGFCPEVAALKKSRVLYDVCSYPRFAANPVVDSLGLRTYAGAPLLHASTDVGLGTICFLGPEPKPKENSHASYRLINARRDALMDRISPHLLP